MVRTAGQRWEALAMYPLRERPSPVVSTYLPENPHHRNAANALLTGEASADISSFLDTRDSKDSLWCHTKSSHPTSVSYWPICCLEGQFHWARKNWGSWLQVRASLSQHIEGCNSMNFNGQRPYWLILSLIRQSSLMRRHVSSLYIMMQWRLKDFIILSLVSQNVVHVPVRAEGEVHISDG